MSVLPQLHIQNFQARTAKMPHSELPLSSSSFHPDPQSAELSRLHYAPTAGGGHTVFSTFRRHKIGRRRGSANAERTESSC